MSTGISPSRSLSKEPKSWTETEPKTSYVNVIKYEYAPTKDQAIIKEYAWAIGNIIGPKSIKYLLNFEQKSLHVLVQKIDPYKPNIEIQGGW